VCDPDRVKKALLTVTGSPASVVAALREWFGASDVAERPDEDWLA